MNTERTSFGTSRFSALFLTKLCVFFAWLAAALLLVGLAATASRAGFKTATPGGTGAVLALAAQLRTARLQAAAASSHTPGGRTLLPRRMMRSGALVRAHALPAASVVPISGGVQTYDINNPPPAFRPLIGFGTAAALNNSSTNPPVYISTLTPTNLTPVWSADETFIVFSSNRTAVGGVNADGTNTDGTTGPRFHLWEISVNGGQAFQITTSTGPASTGPGNGGEFFPVLSRNNLTVAFTSDAATFGTQNLYAFAFSSSALSSGTAAPTNLSVSTANPTPPAPLTFRPPAGGPQTEAASSAVTGFDQVERPTFSPNDDELLAFSAHATLGTYTNHYHVYFLYRSSGGFSNDNNVSFPGKITDGPSDDTDPTYAPDGSYIAFASTAGVAGFMRNPNNALGSDPNTSQSLSSNVAATRSVFLVSGGTTAVPFGTVSPQLTGTGGRVSRGSAGGFDDYGPAWSSFANQNQYTNPSGNFAYLAFARSTGTMAALHDIYYFQTITGVSQPSSETLVPESAAGGANAAIKLNTDDNAGETSTAGNAYEDAYPTWSPFLSIFSIAYASNRTVTYNAPASGVPVEVAASVTGGGTVTTQDATANYTVGANYSGLLVSQVLNLDPPTLLRFSTNEVVHVQAAGALDGNGNSTDPINGIPNKLAVTGGQKITLTVRLSDREAGITNTGGPAGGPRVYVQIKDPDGKYQDSQNAEHKVFAKDPFYNGQANQPLSDVTSGTVNQFIGTAFPGFESAQGSELPLNKYTYPSYGTPAQTTPVIHNRVYPRGAHGGHYFAPDPNNPDLTYIFAGRSALNTFSPYSVQIPYLTTITYAADTTDPTQFIPQGPEYEAQVVNPHFAMGDTVPDTANVTVAYPASYTQTAAPTATSTGRTAHTTAIIGDYVTPYWLAGVDDQGAFSGGTYTSNIGASALPQEFFGETNPDTTTGVYATTVTNGTTQTDRPTSGYMVSGAAVDGTATTTTHPAEWLQLARVSTAQQDNNGGVLYTVTWRTPNSGSDFYVDVIAYDNAVFPNVPNSGYTGKKTNWRIYDNVGGFSTNSSVGGKDILLVSDYALGQKFAATTFGGRNLNLNLVPKIFGTESYLSDVDVNILPDSEFAGLPTSATSYIFYPTVQTLSNGAFGNQPTPGEQNGLGVGSYLDNTINDGTVITDTTTGRTYPNVQSQRYSIWRILSRGPVPTSLLQSYTPTPTPVPQPAIADAADPAYKNIPAATILDAPRCVIWLSPYSGDVLADPGTIDDPGNVGTAGVTNPRQSTTSILTQFVKNGGRLCVTGQDVGSTLTQGGSVGNTASTTPGAPNFLPDVLNATLTSGNSGINVLAGTPNRITGSPFYDNTNLIGNANFDSIIGPIQGPTLEVFPVLPYQDNLVLGNADYGDSGLSQVPATTLPGGASIQGQSDVIAATNGAITAITYGASSGALVYHDDPYGLPAAGATAGALPNGGTGSRVVYAGIGLEGLSEDYYSSASPNPSQSAVNGVIPDEVIPQVFARNPRSEILHNIVNFLRTGRVSGTITQTAGTGQGGGSPIDGVTVYLRPTGAAPSTRAAFSATTANGGRFTIAGVEPGTYTLVALKPGFQRAVSNSNVFFTVEGDTTVNGATLTLTPQQPGNIAGTVHDAAGNPISGATVTFTSQDNSVTKTATTANGSVTGSTTENYFIQSVPVTTYTATASGPLNPQNGLPEYMAATAPDAPNAAGVTVQPNTTLQPVNFTLTTIPAKITGTITSSAGTPVAGATVTVTDSTGATVGTATTAADGTYTITGLAASPAGTTDTVTVSAPGFATSTPMPVTLYPGSTLTVPTPALMPIPPGSIQGTVTYSTGGGVPGAIVTYTAPGGTPLTVTTAADGTYTITAVPPATYSISAVGPNNTNGRPTTSAAPAQPVVVASGAASTVNFTVVPISPSFSGTVTGMTNGTTVPLAGAAVTITGTDATGTAIVPIVVTTAANGTYTTGPLAPGTYTLTGSKGGFTSSTTNPPITVQYGDASTIQLFALAAVAPGSITGTVKDDAGNPVQNAVVVFNSTDGTVTGLTATSGADGSFVIPPPPATGTVPASTYTGTATGPNNANNNAAYHPGAPVTVTISATSSGPANFVLPAVLASVTGKVIDAQTGAVLTGAVVTLTDPTGAVVGTPVTIGAPGTVGADGFYGFGNIRTTQAGQVYTITVTKAGYFTTTQTVTLSLGDAVPQPPIAVNEQATLYGLVTDGSPDVTGNPPLAGATITVTDATGAVVATVPTPLTTLAGTTAGSDGSPENYTANLLPGTYTVTASKGSYNSKTSAVVTLTNTAPKRVDLALISSIGTLGGLVTDQDGTTPAAGATVTAVPTGGIGAGITFTTSASATPGPDGSPLNYTGQLSQGSYTVTVTKGNRTTAAQTVVVTGGAFKRLDFSGASGLPALHTFAAGFQFVSTPYDYSALGFDGLFGTLNTALAGTMPNGNRSHVAVWNPVTGAYALDPNAPADTLRLGVGYWVYLKAAQPVTVQGAAAPGPTVRVSLGKGWNQIGVPRATGIAVTDLAFDNGAGGTISYTQASSSQYNLVIYPLYSYTGGAYQALGSTSTLQPWNAYWIYVNAPATLVIPSQ